MLEGVLFGFALASLSPWICRRAGSAAGWIIGLLTAGLCGYLACYADEVLAGQAIISTRPWIPSLGVSLSFQMDGLSLVFALLISGIGALVAIYSGGYLGGHPEVGRFYLYLLSFMSSMLGLVLSDNVLTLFVFWELTSLTSYLLIGFNHEEETSRSAALQSLLVTGGGGLALLAGLVLLCMTAGSYELSVLAGMGPMIRSGALYPVILLLVLVGAFAKSAQFPLHFWLPNAMAAPTPVSAYLHSSTMVKAGVYLLARMTPMLGGTALWTGLVTVFGAATMLIGAYLALVNTDLKKILAYSTIAILGALTMLLGIGTAAAVTAAATLLVAHALYKAALFLTAGALDHGTGTRDIDRLGGLWRAMPVTAIACVLAALSSAGIPPFFGFISKEAVYEATRAAPQAEWPVTFITMLTNMALVAVAGMVAIRPFFGPRLSTPRSPHEAPVSMWVGPLVLAVAGLAAGLLPGGFDRTVASFAGAVIGLRPEARLSLWHGFGPVLVLSVVTLAGGIGLYLRLGVVRTFNRVIDRCASWGPESQYRRSLSGLMLAAEWQTRWLQSGFLRVYIMIIIAVTVALSGFTLARQFAGFSDVGLAGVASHEWMVVFLILAAALAAICFTSRLAAVAALGAVGYGVVLIFLLYSAPDLAMTQLAIETLAVILFVLVLYRLPRFVRFASWPARIRDAAIALCGGGLMTLLVLCTTAVSASPRLAPYFLEQSLPEGNGRNVVNVILVDFRALDTLGEITVLAVAAIGVFALLQLRPGQGRAL